MKEIIFICGVNGVGKTAVVPKLKLFLSEKEFIIHDFDERGVPENAGSVWRKSEINYWLDQAVKDAENNLTSIICGFIKPTDLGDAIKDVGSKIRCILLDAKPEVIRARLTQRYTRNGVFDPKEKIIGKTVQEFIEGNVYIREQMKADFEKLNCSVIDTSDLTPVEVAEKVVAEIVRDY